MATNRPKIPSATETKVLTRSKRRCCLCVGLEGDLSVKRVQIAHIDHNRLNPKEDNLVPLCLLHHDEYDETKSQSKGITRSELKYYRSELNKVVQKLDEQLKLPITSSSTSSKQEFATPSAKLIGQILEAFDKEVLGLENHRRPNGIALGRLVRVAITEEGDFDAAMEAFMSLVRLHSLETNKGLSGSVNERSDRKLTDKMATKLLTTGCLPRADIASVSFSSLEIMARTDWELFNKAINKTKRFAYIGDGKSTLLSDYETLPFDSFGAVTTILVNACHHFANSGLTYAEIKIANVLMELFISLGFVLRKRGIELPKPPEKLFMPWGRRWVEPQQNRDLFPLVSLAHAIATLPDSSFKSALEIFKYGFSVEIQKHDGTAFGIYDLLEALEILKHKSAFLHSNSLHMVRLKEKKDGEIFDAELRDTISEGNQVIRDLIQFLRVERKLYLEIKRTNK